MNNQNLSAEHRFGQLLRGMRTTAGLSQRELAERMAALGYSSWLQSTVAKTESGERPLRLNEFMGLCFALEKSPTEAMQPLVAEAFELELRHAELTMALDRATRNAQRAAAEHEASQHLVHDARQQLEEFMKGGDR